MFLSFYRANCVRSKNRPVAEILSARASGIDIGRNLSTTDIWCNNKRTLLALHFKKKALPSILFLNLVQKESLVPWDTFSIKLIVEHRIAQADDYC